MEFGWTEEQLSLRAGAVEFAHKYLNDSVAEDDATMRFPAEKWARLADWGYFGLPVPADDGGAGFDYMTSLLVTEGLGAGCLDGGLLFSAVVQLWDVVVPLARLGTPEQKARWLPGLLDGTLVGAIAITEADSGSDPSAMTTAAHPDGDGGWSLTGAKMFITNAPIADVVVCFARTGKGGLLGGITAFLLDTSQPGVVRGPAFAKMGMRTAPVGELSLDGARCVDGDILGKRGGGLAVFNDALEWERVYGLAMYLGSLERELDEARAYARQRRAFGQPIAKFQSVANRLVDMKLRLETSRLLVYRAAWLKASGQSAIADAAMAKLWLSEAAVANGLDAVQVRGAYGYMTETGTERHLRDAIASRVYAGTSEIQRNVVARTLGL